MKYIIITGLLLILVSCSSQKQENMGSSQGAMTSDSHITTSLQGSMNFTGSVRPR